MLARLMTSYAWKARGSTYAENVKESDWKPFFDRLQAAQTHLTQAKTLEEKCPVYWSSQQRIALGLQYEKPQYNAIYSQAIGHIPDYEYYYNSRAIFLLPRWYGEPGEMEKELAKSADRLGGEAGDVLYAQVIWSLNHYGPSGLAVDVFKGQPARCERNDWGLE